MALELENVDFREFQVPLVGNTEAKVMEKNQIKSLLARQVMEPVRFYESIDTMKELGLTKVIEIGPGKVLSGFLKKIDKNIEALAVEDEASLQALLTP